MSGIMTHLLRAMNTRNPCFPLVLSLRPCHRVPPGALGSLTLHHTSPVSGRAPAFLPFPAERTSPPQRPPGPPPGLACPVPGVPGGTVLGSPEHTAGHQGVSGWWLRRCLTGGGAACWGRVEGPVLITTPCLLVCPQGHQAEGEGSQAPAFGECWGPGRGAPRPQKQRPELGVGVPSPLGRVSRTEVREGSGRLGLLPPGRREAALGWWAGPAAGPWGQLWKVVLGCSSLGVPRRKRRAQRRQGLCFHPLATPSTCFWRRWTKWETGLQSEAGAARGPCRRGGTEPRFSGHLKEPLGPRSLKITRVCASAGWACPADCSHLSKSGLSHY